jgi:hypothetical protein
VAGTSKQSCDFAGQTMNKAAMRNTAKNRRKRMSASNPLHDGTRRFHPVHGFT